VKASFPVDAPPEAWAAMADPNRLAAALPGCRSVTRGDGGGGGAGDGAGAGRTGVGTMHVVTEVAVASVRGLWAGTVARIDADAVRVQGSGVPGTVDLVVRADPDRTVVTVEGTVEGPLATVGSSVLAAALRRTAEDLLAAAAAPAEPGLPAASAAPAGPGLPAAAAVPAGPGTTGNLTVDVADTRPDLRRRRRLLVLAGALVIGGAAALGRRLVRRGAA